MWRRRKRAHILFPLSRNKDVCAGICEEVASKASHAGIIRIGFEGIFSAPHRGAPLFQYTQLKHRRGTKCKSAYQSADSTTGERCGGAASAVMRQRLISQ